MDVSLTSDVLNQLNTAEAKALHDISDSLSACGVGKIVNLPQIIVVGEQSSGKSSVLEAISHVRFPVERGVCTRFATELVLRQAPETRVNVSVRFADKSKAPQSFQRTGFHEDDLPDIIKEAKECMGFTRAGKDFSKDVLRLEIQGPGMYPLTLVDLPGFFQTETETQSLNGKETVDELVESYMRQKNSIILAVIAASGQLANQGALRRVKEMDPQRQRILGVITKPDLTHAGLEDEETYLRVAKNQEGANKFHLGWHVLRNRTEKEKSLEARDETEEKFFKTGAWATLPRDDCGIATLRKKLSRVLYNHIRTSLPGVVEDIERKLRERQEELDRLGKSRSTPEDMRSFLLTISSDFQRLARDAVYGRYNDAFFGGLDDDDHKLRAQLRNFNRAFDHILKTKGAKQVIVEGGEDEPEEDSIPEYLQEFLERYTYEFPDPEVITTEDLSSQLQKQAAGNQGLEFPGSPNKDLAIQLFKQQAAPWKEITEFHISRVTFTAKAFVDQLFKHVIGQPSTNRTTEAVLSTCVDPFFNGKEKVLQEKLEELLRPYAEGYALPLDVDFYRCLSQRSMERLSDLVGEVMMTTYPAVFQDGSTQRLTQRMIRQAISGEEMPDGEFGTDKVIDMMLAYYEMSRRTFTDNVINLAIESCLVRDIPDILTPTKVHRMTEERLEELAGESEDSKARRQSLKEEIDILRQGLAQCLRYRPRPVTVLPSSKTRASSAPAPPENPHAQTSTQRPSPSPKPATSTAPTSNSQSASKPATATITNGQSRSQPAAVTASAATAASLNIDDMAAAIKRNAAARDPPPSSDHADDPTSVDRAVGSMFGSSSFGKSTTTANGTGGLFGAKPAAAATTPVSSAPGTSGGLFGSKPAATNPPSFSSFGSFGKPAPAAQPTSSPFGGSIFSKATTPVSSAPATSGGLFSGGASRAAPPMPNFRLSSSSEPEQSPQPKKIHFEEAIKSMSQASTSNGGSSVFGNLPKTPNVSAFAPAKEASPLVKGEESSSIFWDQKTPDGKTERLCSISAGPFRSDYSPEEWRISHQCPGTLKISPG
ncbi:hypothetical protein ACJZ2D_004432 [Fusarium nematophilum]